MVGTASIIPARSKQQALDWSLVLLSQAIESEIEADEEGQWRILVDPGEFGRAARILRLYTLENRTRGKLPPELQNFRFDWGHTWFFALLVLIFALAHTRLPILQQMGMMNSRAFFSGDWWRPLTAVLLHHDVAHLAANLSIGMLLLGLAGGVFGTWRAFWISYASGALANLISATAYGQGYWVLGASGMVMGALGLLTSSSLVHVDEMNRRQLGYRSAAGGVLLLVLLGFNPQPHVDVLAHVSGFFVGLCLGTLTLGVQRRRFAKATGESNRQSALDRSNGQPEDGRS